MDILIEHHHFNGHLLKLYSSAADFHELLNEPGTKLKPKYYMGSWPNLIISCWATSSVS